MPNLTLSLQPPRATLPHLHVPPRPVLLQPPLDERVQLSRTRDRDVHDAEELGGREGRAAGLLDDAELALRVERDGEAARAERLLEARGVKQRRRRGVGEEGEREAEGRVVHRERDGRAFRGVVLEGWWWWWGRTA